MRELKKMWEEKMNTFIIIFYANIITMLSLLSSVFKTVVF